LVAGVEKQTFMKLKSVLLWTATFALIWGITSCKKDGVIELPAPDEQDTTTIIP
jgi:hypothetical protein